jgi:hypothetical protein
MEGINSFWYTSLLISLFLGAIVLILTLAAFVVWLLVRSRASLMFLYATLGCLTAVGAFLVLSLLLIGSSWP